MATARLALVTDDYVADTEVTDEVARAEDLTMHVLLLDDDGEQRWHRKMPETGGLEAACGDRIDYRFVLDVRAERCAGKMCERGCFSDRELVRAAIRNLAGSS